MPVLLWMRAEGGGTAGRREGGQHRRPPQLGGTPAWMGPARDGVRRVRTSPQRGRWGETGAERPVMVRKRNSFLRSRNNDSEVLEETVPSQPAEGLTP